MEQEQEVERYSTEEVTTTEYVQKHISNVRRHLSVIVALLQARANKHDESKLEEPEFSMWSKMDEEPRWPYGSDEYFEKLSRYAYVFEQHYKDRRNRHHPEHFEGGIKDMNLIDIIEMLCDWLGYKGILSRTEAIKIAETQMKRYGFSDDLCALLKNTLEEYFSVIGGFNEDAESEIDNIPDGLTSEIGIGAKARSPYVLCNVMKKKEEIGNTVDICV